MNWGNAQAVHRDKNRQAKRTVEIAKNRAWKDGRESLQSNGEKRCSK